MKPEPDPTEILLDRVSCRVVLAGRQTMPAQWRHPARILPIHDIIFVEAGQGSFHCGTRCQTATAPGWVILPAGLSHAMEGSGLRLAVVHVEMQLGERLDALRVFCPEGDLAPKLPTEAAAPFQHAIDAWMQATPTGRVCANRWMEIWFAVAFGSRPAPVLEARVLQALAWFHANAEHPFLIEEAAQHVGVSEAHLRSLFHRHLGTSPKKIVQAIRLGRACDLLENGSAGVAEAAYQAGWGTVSAFARSFREQFGVSPGAFRRGKSDTRGPGAS